jgi:hypothetical protein
MEGDDHYEMMRRIDKMKRCCCCTIEPRVKCCNIPPPRTEAVSPADPRTTLYDYSPEKTLVIKVNWLVSVQIKGPCMPLGKVFVGNFQPWRNGDFVAKVVAPHTRNTVTTECSCD